MAPHPVLALALEIENGFSRAPATKTPGSRGEVTPLPATRVGSACPLPATRVSSACPGTAIQKRGLETGTVLAVPDAATHADHVQHLRHQPGQDAAGDAGVFVPRVVKSAEGVAISCVQSIMSSGGGA